MGFLPCSIRNSAIDNRRLPSTISTANGTVLQIISSTLVIFLLLVFIGFNCLIGACPTSFAMTLLMCHSLRVVVV
ncbi:hypothetical protein LINGRAHAP2_LOCUS34107 [Linum grandiflorum]